MTDFAPMSRAGKTMAKDDSSAAGYLKGRPSRDEMMLFIETVADELFARVKNLEKRK